MLELGLESRGRVFETNIRYEDDGNTLITVEPHALDVALSRLIKTLNLEGIPIDKNQFIEAHRKAAISFLEQTKKTGRETHNSLWISKALKDLGYEYAPGSPQVRAAIESYFSAFTQYCRLIPGTLQMLRSLGHHYSLGMLSNFTHPPVARRIIKQLGMAELFDVILISGEIGFRKPHPLVFQMLLEELKVGKNELIYIGDDPEVDIEGALRSGIRPVLTTYVKDNNIAYAPGILSHGNKQVEAQIKTISGWQDLMELIR